MSWGLRHTAAYPDFVAPAQTFSDVLFWAEDLEGVEFIEPWSQGEIIDSGNTLDPNAATSLAGSPAGWEDQCLEVVIGATNAGAGLRHEFGEEFTGVIYHRAEIVITADAAANLTQRTFAVVKVSGATFDTAAVTWLLGIWKTSAGDRNLRFRLNDSAVTHDFPTALSLNQVYKAEIKYDIPGKKFELWVDGNIFVRGDIPASWPQNVLRTVMGASGGGTALNYTMYLDNHFLSDEGFPTGRIKARRPLIGVGR